MSNPLYEKSQTTAIKLLEKYGQSVILKKNNEVDDSEPWNKLESTEQESINVVFSELRDIITKEVKEGYLKAYATPGSLTPEINDSIVRGDDEWTIISSIEIKPAEMLILYEFGLRK